MVDFPCRLADKRTWSQWARNWLWPTWHFAARRQG